MARRRGQGPCGFFGVTLDAGSQIVAIFDMITGASLFVGCLAVLLIGELGEKHVYPSEKFNMPRELVITFVCVGYYNLTTGLFLYFVAGYRKRMGCILWILLNAPLAVVDFVKIYQIVVVYMFSKEIKHGKVASINNSDEEKHDIDTGKKKKRKFKMKCCRCIN